MASEGASEPLSGPGGTCWLTVRCSAPEVTEAFGEALGRHLAAGSVLGLVGELGAGKTCLVRGLARGLGIPRGVTSPTFTRMVAHAGRLPLYHFDAWRDGSGELMVDSQEFLGGDGVAVIEWADRVTAFLPRPRLEVRLAHLGPESRALSVLWIAAEGDVPGAGGRQEEAARTAVRSAGRIPALEIVDPA